MPFLSFAWPIGHQDRAALGRGPRVQPGKHSGRSMKASALRLLGGVLPAMALIAALGVVESATAAGPLDADNGPIIVYTTGRGPAFASNAAADRLRAFVAQHQRARVIVGLRTIMRMEHTLTAAQTASQRQVLAAAQGRVAARVLGSASAPDVTRFTSMPFMSLYVTPAQLDRLLADPEVASVERDLDFKLEAASASQKQTRLPYVWDKGFGGTGYVVAVLDSGVDRKHEMFKNKMAAEACFGTNDAGEAINSDCAGDAVSTVGTGSAKPCAPNVDGCEHGSHVASIAIGNGPTLDGVARGAKLIAIKVVSMRNDGTSYTIKANDVAQALDYVYGLRETYKIAAVNMSFGLPDFAQRNVTCDGDSAILTTAVGNLRAAGIAPIKSSGNNNNEAGVTFPGCISTMIAVGNVTNSDVARKSSNHSPLVKLMAPGTNIKGAVPKNSACLSGGETKYCNETGTSQAAPFVGGSIAVLRSAKSAASLEDVLSALTCSGRMIDKRDAPGGTPTDIFPARPRVDLQGAFNLLKNPKQVEREWVFDKADELHDWSPLRGDWTLSGGNYNVASLLPAFNVAMVANCSGSFDAKVRMKRIDPDKGWYSGLFLKSIADFDNDRISGYWFAYSNSLNTSTNKRGFAVVFEVDRAYVHETNSYFGASVLCASTPMPFNDGSYVTLRVVSKGSALDFYVNGKLLCSRTDTTYAFGPLAVLGVAPKPATANTHKLFVDSVSIKALRTPTFAPPSAAVMNVSALGAPAAAPGIGAQAGTD